MRRLLRCFFFLCVPLMAGAQDLDYARKTIDSLCHSDLHGRSWFGNGEQKAADLIEQEFRTAGLQAFGASFQQDFSFPLNTFPGKVSLQIGKVELIPGKDFLVMPYSGASSGTFSVVRINQSNLKNYISSKGTFNSAGLKGKVVMIDTKGIEEKSRRQAMEGLARQLPKVAGVILLEEKKLTHSLSQTALDYPVVRILRSALPKKVKKLSWTIEQEFQAAYEAQNVIGYVKGTAQPDSFIVFSAHYDHLGRMGTETYFPGANDNGSGTALLMDLARHYGKNPARYSVVFIAFGAEEAGLVGSEFYTKNPLFPLKQIRFLLNIDLMGNGEDGITVVNGKVFTEAYDRLVKLNDEHQWVSSVKSRGKAANSDHYHFSEKGVPAFFIYTRGANPAYHDLDDHAGNIGLYKYNELFQLLLTFSEAL